jgi:uncharacterized protein
MSSLAAHQSPVYNLHCRSARGEAVVLTYRPHQSELTDAAGVPLLADAEACDHVDALPISPENPGRKSAAVRTLKIQLGLRCNYQCSYCNQASAIPDAAVTRTADADQFLAGLDEWLQGTPERIEFWGGEPLLYLAKLKRLVPPLRQRFPAAALSLVSNGSLLDEDVLDFIERWNLVVTVSHDGPGQPLRGPDPFSDPPRAKQLKDLWNRRAGTPGRVGVNVVFTPANADVGKTAEWIAQRLPGHDVGLHTEGAVAAYDEGALKGAANWTEDAYSLLHKSIVDGFSNGSVLRYASIHEKARDFVESLRTKRPASALGQKCGMDQADQLAVDLHGNVMTCQNTGAQGKHRIGHVSRLDEVRLDTATHWSHRECCQHCPVLQLCKGSCMYLEDEFFAQSCENEYRYNQAILAGVLQSLTGLTLERISGDIRRPPRRRTIPIAPAAA